MPASSAPLPTWPGAEGVHTYHPTARDDEHTFKAFSHSSSDSAAAFVFPPRKRTLQVKHVDDPMGQDQSTTDEASPERNIRQKTTNTPGRTNDIIFSPGTYTAHDSDVTKSVRRPARQHRTLFTVEEIAAKEEARNKAMKEQAEAFLATGPRWAHLSDERQSSGLYDRKESKDPLGMADMAAKAQKAEQRAQEDFYYAQVNVAWHNAVHRYGFESVTGQPGN